MRMLDITGQKFGRLLVTSRAENTASGQARWNCLCDCGKEHVIKSQVLRSGISKSCGCLNIEVLSKRKRTHGHTTDDETSPTYHSWSGMMNRCKNKNHRSFHNYGGRGITVCEHWHTFSNFLEDMGIKPEKLSLDRIDNSLAYSPENCHWATIKQQSRNKRTTHLITHNGMTKCVTEWAEYLNINKTSLNWRIHNGYTYEEALTIPFK
jgi:hypothetical protein